jgi:hypothetical protein
MKNKSLENIEQTNILHLVHLWYNPCEQPELEKNIQDFVDSNKIDLVYIVEEPEIIKLDKAKAEKMIERYNYVWVNQFMQVIRLKWITWDLAKGIWWATWYDIFKSMFEVEWLVFNQEIYYILCRDVFNDIDLSIFNIDCEDLSWELLEQRNNSILHLEENKEEYYRKINERINIDKDIYWFSKEMKPRIPSNKNRYSRIVDYIKSELWEDKVIHNFMYDWLPFYSEEEASFCEEDFERDRSDIDLMHKIMYSSNREMYIDMLNFMHKKFWKKSKFNHMLWWEYLRHCVTKYWSNFNWHIIDLWSDSHKIYLGKDVSIEK